MIARRPQPQSRPLSRPTPKSAPAPTSAPTNLAGHVVCEPVDLPRGWWRGLVYRPGIAHCVYGCVGPTEDECRATCERWIAITYKEVSRDA